MLASKLMRTTIELTESHRARLVEIAARRGEKGYSKIIREALDTYFREIGRRDAAVREALDALGTLAPEEGAELHETVRRLRSRWR